MPTIDDFKNLNPSAFSNYGGDRGNVNFLISSSVSGSGDDAVQIAPFVLQGMTLPLKSKEGTAIANALKEVEKLNFDYAGKNYTATILDRTNRSTHFYIRTQDLILEATASADGQGNPREVLSELVFTPFFASNFNNSDNNPLLSNSDLLKTHDVAMVVDRNTDQQTPSNLDAIIAGTAQAAQIQNCAYTKAGLINARYVGTKLTSGSVEGDDPALGLVTFKASIHPTDSDVTTIKSIQLSDRDVTEVRFDSKRIETGSSYQFQNFPSGSNILYVEEGSRTVRLANQKIYSIDKNEVYTSDENGVVSSVL